MICTCIANRTFTQIQAILKTVEMAEIRLDLCPSLTDEQIEKIFNSDVPLVATCRGIENAESKLMLAISAGAHYVDLDIDAPRQMARRLTNACAQYGTNMIRSYHNFELTPDLDTLRSAVDRCRHADAQVIKIATTARAAEDQQRVLSLYKYYTPESLIAFSMNDTQFDALSSSRIECLKYGAPFSYASLSTEDTLAPGQIPYETMAKAVYGEKIRFVGADVHMPASKSYAQRAIIAAALAEGTTTLKAYTPCGDSDAALEVAKALGAQVRVKRGPQGTRTVEIDGVGANTLNAGITGVPVINVGESGLLARLMIPLMAQLSPEGARIEGEGTLKTRVMDGAVDAIRALGGEISGETVPLSVKGPVAGGYTVLDGSRTSQIISGLMMALPLGERGSILSVRDPASIPYLYMTMEVLRKFGVKVRAEMFAGRHTPTQEWSKCNEILLKIREKQQYKAATVDLEGDWSAAAVFLAAGAVFGQVSISGLDTTSIQADLGIIDVLMDAGASVSQMDEPRGVIAVRRAPLYCVREDLSNSPDLFPVVAVMCAFCQGRSVLRGVHRLRHKESDRAEGILRMLLDLGVRAELSGDDLVIDGENLASRCLNGRLLKGGNFSSNGDHRMVMALRLAALGASSEIVVDDLACVAKSFPEFNELWNNTVNR